MIGTITYLFGDGDSKKFNAATVVAKIENIEQLFTLRKHVWDVALQHFKDSYKVKLGSFNEKEIMKKLTKEELALLTA